MNILIPHKWLLEHLDTAVNPQEIQRLLSLSGPSIERIYTTDTDSVYDIEVTTNRVDMMSVRGIAREAAVILEQAGSPATLKPLAKRVTTTLADCTPKTTKTLPLPKITNDPKLCNRITCIVLTDIKRNPTPEWMATQLQQVDQNVHDAAIDITNYITHELGHPCHAFDYDAIMQLGGEIIVTTAQAGEKFTTLDGISYTAVGGEVVFKNPNGEIIDLPGIKGTANTAIGPETTNILLWIESVPAQKIRFASMTHAIRTVAAQLNEKNVDPHLAEDVLCYGVQLYTELCDAVVASPCFDSFPGEQPLATIAVTESKIAAYLGLTLPTETIVTIMQNLGCTVTTDSQQHTLMVTPPSFRPDITIPQDVIEEVARIYGYHNLPSALMHTAIPTVRPRDTNFQLEHRLKRFLAALGWQELYTYSMVSETIALESGLPLDQHLRLQNPLTDDRVLLRRSLIPSLNEIISQNQHLETLSVFELAHVYHPQAGELPQQKLHFSLLTTRSYRELIGVVEAVLKQCFISKIAIAETSDDVGPYTQKALIQLTRGGKQLRIGEVGVLANGRVGATLDVATIVAHARTHPHYQPIPKTSPIIENYTFTLPAATKIGPVLTTIQAVNPVITSVAVLDNYQQNVTFKVTYWDYEKPLSNELIEPIRKTVIEAVAASHQGTLVGSLA